MKNWINRFRKTQEEPEAPEVSEAEEQAIEEEKPEAEPSVEAHEAPSEETHPAAEAEENEAIEKEKDQEEAEPTVATSRFFNRLKEGMRRTRENIGKNVDQIFSRHAKIDEDFWMEMEETLIQADVGVEVTMRIIDDMRERARKDRLSEPTQLIGALKEELLEALEIGDRPALPERVTLLIVGVNGTGKTTTIAKLANLLNSEGRKILLGAADTFRAAAVEQLDTWAGRMGVDIIKHERGSDPAAVVFDSVKAAKARNVDTLIIDTAGRLHTYVNLMEELKKIKRIAVRESGETPVHTLLVIDATTGQNGIAQARLFDEALKVNGVVLTKLDGTAKGGIAIAIQQELGIPIEYIGLGESMDDLQKFDAASYVDALVGG